MVGEGQLTLRMPGTQQDFSHTMQVTNDGVMPAELRILGIGFWHKLDSNIDMASQTVSGVTPAGESFKARFQVQKGDRNSINSHHSQPAEEKHTLMLAEAVQIHPGQVVELKFATPESMAEQINRSWKHNWFVRNMPECWKSFKNEILWEPSTYSIVTSDATDFYQSRRRSDQHNTNWRLCTLTPMDRRRDVGQPIRLHTRRCRGGSHLTSRNC